MKFRIIKLYYIVRNNKQIQTYDILNDEYTSFDIAAQTCKRFRTQAIVMNMDITYIIEVIV